MEPWKLSDGTKVYLGGKVEGESGVADGIRETFRLVREGEFESSGFGPVPHRLPLDLEQPHLLDSWLVRQFGASEVTSPEFDTPALEPRPDPPEGALY